MTKIRSLKNEFFLSDSEKVNKYNFLKIYIIIETCSSTKPY